MPKRWKYLPAPPRSPLDISTPRPAEKQAKTDQSSANINADDKKTPFDKAMTEHATSSIIDLVTPKKDRAETTPKKDRAETTTKTTADDKEDTPMTIAAEIDEFPTLRDADFEVHTLPLE